MNAALDAAALLAVLLQEPGADTVIPFLRTGMMSAVNIAECCSRAPERGSSTQAVLRAVRRFEMTVMPFGLQEAMEAAALRGSTRPVGASIGDRVCLALARAVDLPMVTGDRRRAVLDLGIDIRLIR